MIIRIFSTCILSLLLVACSPTPVPDSASSKPVLFGENFKLAVLKNGWYHFTERELGYSIDYPPTAYLTVSQTVGLEYPQTTITFRSSTEFQEMQIIVYSNLEQLPLNEIILQNIYQGKLSEDEVQKLSLEPIEVAGLDAMKLDKTPFLPGIFISANSKVYFILLPMEMLVGNPPSSESVDIFYEIVNTFSLKQ